MPTRSVPTLSYTCLGIPGETRLCLISVCVCHEDKAKYGGQPLCENKTVTLVFMLNVNEWWQDAQQEFGGGNSEM